MTLVILWALILNAFAAVLADDSDEPPLAFP